MMKVKKLMYSLDLNSYKCRISITVIHQEHWNPSINNKSRSRTSSNHTLTLI